MDNNLLESEWKTVPFTKLIDKKKHRIGKVKRKDYLDQGKHPIIDQGQDFIVGYSNDDELVYDGELPIILFGDHTRFFKFIDFPFVAGADGTQLIVPKKEIITAKYFYYALLNTPLISRGYSRHFSLLKQKYIPVPPLVEQRGIAEVLGTVDEVIRLTDQVIERTETLKRGLMQRLLTQGIGQTEFKDTPLGKIPKTWKVQKLGKSLKLCDYGLSYPLSNAGKYPIFRMNNFEDGLVVDNDMKYLDLLNEEFERFKLVKGDILFNRTNSYDLVGKVGIYLLEGNQTFASYLIRLRTKNELEPKYLNYFLNLEQTQNRLKQLATRGVSQSNINAQSLKSINIPVPSLEEQYKIIDILENQDLHKRQEKIKKHYLSLVKQGLMQTLLSGKVRIELREDGLHRIR